MGAVQVPESLSNVHHLLVGRSSNVPKVVAAFPDFQPKPQMVKLSRGWAPKHPTSAFFEYYALTLGSRLSDLVGEWRKVKPETELYVSALFFSYT